MKGTGQIVRIRLVWCQALNRIERMCDRDRDGSARTEYAKTWFHAWGHRRNDSHWTVLLPRAPYASLSRNLIFR